VVRAVANLLDNAIKWNPDGKPVEVTVDRGEVTVRDHGPGISEQDLPYIFDRFYRSAAARGRPGSGLGLAIVRQVAESHGGEVAVEDAEEGGARFRLRLERAA
jgi:two-component system sensor histidine kinase MprB